MRILVSRKDTSWWTFANSCTSYYTYLHINRTTGVLAKELGAAVIVLEHRYWGVSSPFAELTTKNMRYLTLENSIKDLTNFANNAKLPFDPQRKSHPKKAPWIFSGGSYSGALAAWTESVAPGTFWAYHSSSAPVEAVGDYWGYFLPVQQGMPKNCSKDISLVIDYLDNIGLHGTQEEQDNVKSLFGLEGVEHFDDFAAALENGPWLWQGNQFYQNAGFFDFCDAIEGVTANSTVPGEEGVGLETALAGYASWVNETMLPGFCAGFGYWTDERSVDCFDTYNASNPMFTDTTLSNTVYRQWVWMTCNEPFGYWQDGAPSGRPTIVSRLVNAKYWERQCGLFFPEEDGYTYGLARGVTYEDVNKYTGGWNHVNSTRLIHVGGEFDPWRSASVVSELRPGGVLQSTKKVPVEIVPGGFHTSDLLTLNGLANEGCQKVIDTVVATVTNWVSQFPKGYGQQ